MLNILTYSIKVQRKSFIFWGIGILGLIALYMAVYPSIRDSAEELNQYLDKLPEALKGAFISTDDYSSPIGYISSEIYTTMMPILFLIFAIGFGSGAIAGEEEKGTLEILLANPIRRSRVVLEKFGALAISLLILSGVVVVGLFIGMKFVDMHIALLKIVAATFSLFLLALNFGTLALLIGAFTGNRGIAIGLTTAVAVLAFFVNALSSVASFLEKFQKFSPFYHYAGNEPLKNGLDLGSVVFFICVILAFLILSIALFEKRDLKL